MRDLIKLFILSLILATILSVFIRCSDSATGTTEDILQCPDGTKKYGKKCIPIDSGLIVDEYMQIEDAVSDADEYEDISESEDVFEPLEETKDIGPADKGPQKICTPRRGSVKKEICTNVTGMEHST